MGLGKGQVFSRETIRIQGLEGLSPEGEKGGNPGAGIKASDLFQGFTGQGVTGFEKGLDFRLICQSFLPGVRSARIRPNAREAMRISIQKAGV